jgi:5-methyltetrahydropteroyltriglutamate--homocysteine methyltransferase
MLDGVEICKLDRSIQFRGLQTKPKSICIPGKIGFSNLPMLEHFKFSKAHTEGVPKMLPISDRLP